MITFRIQYDTVWGEALGIMLEGRALPMALSTTDGHWWEATVEATQLCLHDEAEVGYRYAVWKEGALVRVEQGRRPHILTAAQLAASKSSADTTTALTDAWTDLPAESYEKRAGTAVPLFSLRSEGSQGVGDFGDLKAMVDWCLLTEQKALQILPINDTTKSGSNADSYPYSSISIFAFHPMYIDLRQLNQAKGTRAKEILAELAALNTEEPHLAYEAVNRLKHKYLHLLYEQTGKQTLKSTTYTYFLSANADWLLPYAAFCILRDKYGTPCFSEWKTYSQYEPAKVTKLHEAHPEEMDYYCWLQFLLHLQLLDATAYAREHGILIKGDIPIGIDRCSVEAWTQPHLFHMDSSAGAPPDAFSANGQNWGFPTYNWEAMASDGYAWWQRRFRKMAEYFTAYRIDHVLGFFRIWDIPTHSVHGLLGQFSPALPMTAEEISRWGINFREDLMTRPYITDALIDRSFGEHAEQVRRTFLRPLHDDVWELLPQFQTQRQVETWFYENVDDNDTQVRGPLYSESTKETLYALISNVLFVRDKQGRGWHPRICGRDSYTFSQLTPAEQAAYDRLYQHYYYERHNHYWYATAMQKLPTLINSSPLLPCGEDLGMVPDCVAWVMRDLQILSLEIERMSKCPWEEFSRIENYPALSVCTIGTHDMSTLRGWWEEDCTTTQHYYNNVLGRVGDAPKEASAEICEMVVRRHLAGPSALCILALQDWLAMDSHLRHPNPEAERINVPANPHHFWCYRMHLTIEQLMQAHPLNAKIKALVLNA